MQPLVHIRRAFALMMVFVAAAACGATPVAPLPYDSPPLDSPVAGTTAPTASALVTSSAPVTRTRPPPRPPPTTPACLGAVKVTLRTDVILPPESMCVAAGAILRVEDTGPGTVSAEPSTMVSCPYAGGVVECRFLHAGTVIVRIERDVDDDIEIAVVVK